MTRNEFKEYCLRKLGKPVIDINVDNAQVEDRISDALAVFNEYHFDGYSKEYVIYSLTATDITNRYIQLDNTYQSVLRVFPMGNFNNSLNLEFQSYMTDVIELVKSSKGLSSYLIAEQWIADLNQFFNREKPIRFNKTKMRLYIDTDWSTSFKEGDIIVMEAFVNINGEQFPQVFESPWLQYYAAALIKQQWGQNLIKYEGIALIGGMTLNGRQIYDDAKNDIEALEEQLRTTYELPMDFYMG